jgi:short-subunit dehydrogenase
MKIKETIQATIVKLQHLNILLDSGGKLTTTQMTTFVQTNAFLDGALRQLSEEARRRGIDVKKLLGEKVAEPLKTWSLSETTLSTLEKKGILTSEDLAARTQEEMMGFPGLDRIAHISITAAMRSRGLTFRKA